MSISWSDYLSRCKSPLSALAIGLYRSRERLRLRCRELRRKFREAQKRIARLTAQLQSVQADHQAVLDELEQLVQEQQSAQESAPASRFDDPALRFHSFSASMIALCVNVAKRVGLRAAEDVLQVVFEWLGQSSKIPDWTTIRSWCQRIGLASLVEHGKHEDWIWIADHSNQIGQEKVLVVLGIRAGELPEKGSTLGLSQVKLLTLRVGKDWSRDDMRNVYQELQREVGTPRAVLVDGAVELRDSVDVLQKSGKDVLVLRDYKHYLANRLESIIGHTEDFKELIKQVNSTRSAIQQTELAAFTPPSLKSKSRFMNLDTLYQWSQMVLWHLENRNSDLWKQATEDRIESKLGWLRKMKGKLQSWFECQEFIRQSCHLVNTEGLFRGLHRKLRRLCATTSHKLSRQLVADAVAFVKEHESKLRPGERLWLSTEILESLFGHYKQLEGQHSKSGFTSLIMTLGIFVTKVTTQVVERAMQRVKVKDIAAWRKKHLPKSLASSKASAYRAYRKATKNRATASAKAV